MGSQRLVEHNQGEPRGLASAEPGPRLGVPDEQGGMPLDDRVL